MEFVNLTSSLHGGYLCKNTSNIKMNILGDFLASDVGCVSSVFREWVLNDNWGDACSGNLTALEKDGDYIFLSDLYSEEEIPTVLKISRDRLAKLLDDWEKKACKLSPKEVTIKYENGEFIMETKS